MNEYTLDEGLWYHSYPVMDNDGSESVVDDVVPITDVPVNELLECWEDLVGELSVKEVALYNLKEAYLIAESKIVNETDFKALYGANNQKVRDNHVKTELSDMVAEMKALEFGISFIKQYIPLLREVVRCKQ